MDLFTLAARLELDTSDYEVKISDVIKSAKEAGEEIDAALSGGTTGSGSTGGAVQQSGSKTGGYGETIKAILTSDLIRNAGQTIVGLGKDSIETASSLKEVQNVVDQTFGTSAATINAWAKSTAKSFGLSELQAKQFAGYMGSALQSSGIEQSLAAEMSMGIAGLAGDMASFYNIGIEDAFSKIQSGMSGEIEPLRRYGLNLGADAVGEYAGKKLSDMTEAERYIARYQYLMDRTTTIQGDFSRTENEFANASRTLDNNASRYMASVGEKLLPIITSGTNAANSLFDALLSESTQDTLAGIDEVRDSTTYGIEQSANTARAAVSVLEDYGDKTKLTAEQQKQWEAVATELIRTIPELSGMINMQTGEIYGGTKALEDNIAAWETAGKEAADTSALQAKQDMLKGIGEEISREQGLLSVAQKQMEQHAFDMAGLGAMIANEIGVEYDGTAEGFRKMMDSMEAFYAAQSLGFSDSAILSMLSDYDIASEKVEEHQKKIGELETEYKTVEEGLNTSTGAIQSDVDAMGESVTGTFDEVGKATDGLIAGFDQSDLAYKNAYNTGIGATNGLNAAYGSFSAAANAYSLRSSLLGGGVPSNAPKLAVGLDYVPYNGFPALLDEGETVLTKAEAADWRRGGSVQAIDYNAMGSVVGSAVREALVGIGLYTDDGTRIADLTTRRVSRNIANDARYRRYQPV